MGRSFYVEIYYPYIQKVGVHLTPSIKGLNNPFGLVILKKEIDKTSVKYWFR